MKLFSRLFLLVALMAFSSALFAQKQTKVLIKTTKGDIKIALYNDQTPLHAANFKKLVKKKFYDGVLFHRVIKDFMIQTGDPDSKKAEPGDKLGNGGPAYTVPAEFRTPDIFHRRGMIAAARMGDDVNPEKASSSCQFYIVWGKVYNESGLDKMQTRIDERTKGKMKLTPEMREVYKTTGGTPHLDGSYTVFGEVLSGMEVVDAIQQMETDKSDRPKEDVRILSARIVRK